ncbi:MAG TPA: hypothetical protein VHS31_19460, partial [Tepidisphaeraceae bacterium]|nr:hypothetical protein [Tepidisphaeraceae bacterium]
MIQYLRLISYRLNMALRLAAMIFAVLGQVSIAHAQNVPPLRMFPTISADGIGRALQEAMIWTDPPLDDSGVAVAFRRAFDLLQKPTVASLSIFADARYVLWVNGVYVDRGPSRFQPNGPQYDVVNVASHLQSG